VYGWFEETLALAFGIRAVAMSSIARVIFIVDWTLLIRRRIRRSSAEATAPNRLRRWYVRP
jgi:hypothetical protein